jgi:transposase
MKSPLPIDLSKLDIETQNQLLSWAQLLQDQHEKDQCRIQQSESQVATKDRELQAIILEHNVIVANKEQALQTLQARTDQFETTVASQASEMADIKAFAQKQIAISHAKDIKIQALTLELARYKRIQYGPIKETLSSLQYSLFEEDIQIDLNAMECELEACSEDTAETRAQRTRSKHAGRNALPDHLPRIDHLHEPASCQCGHCGQNLVKIRDEITEQLDVEPARFWVHRHIRPQYACRQCETVVAEPAPPAVIDGGLAAPGLLSWLVVSKYVDHLPLYRLEQIAARQSVPLARSTLAEWVGRTAVTLQPLVDRLTEHLMQGNTLHADETPVSQLDPGKGKVHKSYLWAYRSNDLDLGPRIIVFDYQTGRSGQHARNFLSDWQGHLMVDDYGGYKSLFVPNGDGKVCVELACLAHARRKFFDLYQADKSPLAMEALTRLAGLYQVEADARDLSIEERKQLRAKRSLPILKDLKDWLQDKQLRVAPNSGAAKAIHYLLKRWHAFERYAYTGHLPMDNNAAENTIRPIAIGKKNWLFTGSERAGRRAAAIQTLLGTARLNGLDPAKWLKETLEKLPTWPNSRIDELMPFNPEVIQHLIQK